MTSKPALTGYHPGVDETTIETWPGAAYPLGVTFAGRDCSEPRLIGLAHAFEQATRRRIPPPP